MSRRPVQYPSTNNYQERVAAWVFFSAQSFSTRPDIRKQGLRGGTSPAYILPLQRYNSPNSIGYEESKPGFLENMLMGVRDIATGNAGGLTRLSKLYMNLPILKGFSLNNISDLASGGIGADSKEIDISEMSFTKAPKRVHAFGFSLYAKNKKDAENIDEIVNGFQARMYPQFFNATLNKATPPQMWTIKIKPNGGNSDSQVLDNHIKTCVLVNMTATRMDPSSIVLTKDNYFLGIELTLTFTEIEAAYRSISEPSPRKLYSRNEISTII